MSIGNIKKKCGNNFKRNFQSEIYVAADMAFATIYMTFNSACDSKALVTNGRRLYKIDD